MISGDESTLLIYKINFKKIHGGTHTSYMLQGKALPPRKIINISNVIILVVEYKWSKDYGDSVWKPLKRMSSRRLKTKMLPN